MIKLEERLALLSNQHKQLLASWLRDVLRGESKPVSGQFRKVENSAFIAAPNHARTQLVAYFTRHSDQQHEAGIDTEVASQTDFTKQLQAYLLQQLPIHQRPAVLIALEELPRLPNGKISVVDLPVDSVEKMRASERSDEPDESKTDENTSFDESGFHKLASILAGLLGMQDIRPGDNFFELGGDSITAIQFVSKARETGINIDIRSLTAATDIGSLVQIGETSVPESLENPSGPVPLTPIQRWFFSQQHARPAHWNLAGRVDIHSCVDIATLRKATVDCIKAYPALGTRFICEDGDWHAMVPTDFPQPEDLVVIHPANQQLTRKQLHTQLIELQLNFNLEDGILIRFLLHHNESSNSTVLAWVAHHLVIDAISVDIMIADIESRYKALQNPELVEVAPASSVSSREWAIALATIADRPVSDMPDRQGQDASVNDAPFADDQLLSSTAFDQSVVSTEADVVDRVFSIDAEVTSNFLATNDVLSTTTSELLVTALGEAWCTLHGSNCLSIDVESHGRNVLNDHRDTTGTVGWLTSFYPVTIDMSAPAERSDRIKIVKESMRNASNEGKFSLLHRFSSTQLTLDRIPPKVASPPILFNFMGQLTSDAESVDTVNWQNQSITENFLRHHDNRRSHPVEINAFIKNNQVCWYIRFSRLHVSEQQIDTFCSLLMSEIERIASESQSSAFTPSDFPGLQMDQGELDSFLSSLELNSTDNDE